MAKHKKDGGEVAQEPLATEEAPAEDAAAANVPDELRATEALGDAEYGNWVSNRFVQAPLLVAGAFAAAALATGVVGRRRLSRLLLVPALPAGLAGAYFAYARRLLAAGGGELQARVQELVLEHLDWDGDGAALDIGCGNGPLTVALAERFPRARVTGLDYWGESWEYSEAACAANAARRGVAERTSFQRGSAAALPFADGSFSAVVSNLCFHEVRDARDKREVVREALRVLEPGGAFAFQDLFGMKRTFGTTDELLAAVRGWGVGQVDYLDTGHSPFIPTALRLPFMVGTMGVVYGRK